MKKWLNILAALSAICAAFCSVLYAARGGGVILSLAITFATTAYHLVMRLGVGFAFDKLMRNRADYTNRWYRPRSWEKRLYEKLRVKRWKGFMPSYEAGLFNPAGNSWEDIAQSSCQAELVHETIILLSFVPVAFSIWFGTALVFIITSLLAALFDSAFVIMQRYNRPRIVRLIEMRAFR